MMHVILTGPQRTGKSFMLEILTRCGFDTGFTVEDFSKGDNEFFEMNLWGEHYERRLPYILKHARLSNSLADRADRFEWDIQHVYIFVRQVDDCVDSSVKLKRGGTHKEHRRRYFDRLGKIVYQVIERDWPYTIIQFSKLTTDWKYAKQSLGFLVETVSDEEFKRAWIEAVKRRSMK